MRNRFRSFLVNRVPAGISLSPFEFAFLAGYLIPGGKVLFEIYARDKDATIAALPFRGWELSGWVWMLFLGALFGCAGIIFQSFRRTAVLGLQSERGGLFLFGAALTTYVAGIINLIGWSFNSTTLVSLVLLLAAMVYKILQISSALETLDRSRKGVDR